MKPSLRLTTAAVAMAAAVVALRADVPHIYAIRGARIVPVAGATIPSGTVVIRNGVIEAVGASVDLPKDARVIEGAGLTVYPGLIDLGSSAGVDQTQAQQPAGLRTTEEAERWKRTQIFRPDFDVAGQVRSEAPELARYLGMCGKSRLPMLDRAILRVHGVLPVKRAVARRQPAFSERGIEEI